MMTLNIVLIVERFYRGDVMKQEIIVSEKEIDLLVKYQEYKNERNKLCRKCSERGYCSKCSDDKEFTNKMKTIAKELQSEIFDCKPVMDFVETLVKVNKVSSQMNELKNEYERLSKKASEYKEKFKVEKEE